MNIYHSTQEWDKLNQSLSDIFGLEYQPTAMPTIDIIKETTEIPWNKGKQLSDEHKSRLSAALRGQTISVETKIKMSESAKGNMHWIKGKHWSVEAITKRSATNKGSKRSEETRLKMSEAAKRRKK